MDGPTATRDDIQWPTHGLFDDGTDENTGALSRASQAPRSDSQGLGSEGGTRPDEHFLGHLFGKVFPVKELNLPKFEDTYQNMINRVPRKKKKLNLNLVRKPTNRGGIL